MEDGSFKCVNIFAPNARIYFHVLHNNIREFVAYKFLETKSEIHKSI